MVLTMRRALRCASICVAMYLGAQLLRGSGVLSFLPEPNMAAAVQAMGGVLTGQQTAGEAVAVLAGMPSSDTAQPVFFDDE